MLFFVILVIIFILFTSIHPLVIEHKNHIIHKLFIQNKWHLFKKISVSDLSFKLNCCIIQEFNADFLFYVYIDLYFYAHENEIVLKNEIANCIMYEKVFKKFSPTIDPVFILNEQI